MADKSAIEWTDATWNPVVGCTIVSPGCTRCYAMGMAARIEAMTAALQAKGQTGAPHYNGTTRKVSGNTVWTGKLAMAPNHIVLEPLTWRTPRRIFVNSMGDLFHEDVPDAWIDMVFAVMALSPQHTFQVLTKRAKRMREYLTDPAVVRRVYTLVCEMTVELELFVALIAAREHEQKAPPAPRIYLDLWPLPNVWLGVSAERQQEADERVSELLATPAAVRFVSAEPLLGPIDFGQQQDSLPSNAWLTWLDGLDWIIVGGESGPDARPMHHTWARSIRDQCAAAGVSFFFKQWGEWTPICAMDDGQSDRYFDPPPERDPEAIRRCRIGQCIMHADGERFDLDQWSRNLSKRATHAFTAGNHAMHMFKVGKKAAGRLLDGAEHNAMPELREVLAL